MTAAGHALLAGDERRALMRFTMPIAAAMVLVGATTLADTFFVARLGSAQLAALGFTIPIVAFVNQLFLGYGAGVSAVTARMIGTGGGAGLAAWRGILLGVVAAAGFALLVRAGSPALLSLLGAHATVHADAVAYLDIWLLQAPAALVTFAGTAALRPAGKPMATLTATLLSSLVGVALDPLLIFGVGPLPALGLRGAALAAVIGSLAACAFTIRSMSRAFPRGAAHAGEAMPWTANARETLSVALPAMLNFGLMPLAIALLTRLCAGHGALAVAAFGACGRLWGFVRTVPTAVAGAVGPYVGVNRAAQRDDRVTAGVAFGMRLVTLWGLGASVVFLSLGVPIGRALAREAGVAAVIAGGLAILALGLVSEARLVIASAIFNNVQRASLTAVIGALRAGTLVALGVLGARLAGVYGVFTALSLSALATDAFSSVRLRAALPRPKAPPLTMDAPQPS